jgi:hypothetical protein
MFINIAVPSVTGVFCPSVGLSSTAESASRMRVGIGKGRFFKHHRSLSTAEAPLQEPNAAKLRVLSRKAATTPRTDTGEFHLDDQHRRRSR